MTKFLNLSLLLQGCLVTQALLSVIMLAKALWVLNGEGMSLWLCRCSQNAVLSLAHACGTQTPSQSFALPTSSNLNQLDGEAAAASMLTMRLALQRALWQSNVDFWKQNRPAPEAMAEQSIGRRNQLALQLFLRMHILIATNGVQSLVKAVWNCKL